MFYKLKVKRVNSNAVIPKRATIESAGVDLYACIDKDVVLHPGDIKTIGTGIAIAPAVKGCPHDARWACFIYARSGLATKYGVAPVNCVGVIDSDYRGEVKVALINHGKENFVVENGMRIAQLVMKPVLFPEIIEVDELDKTSRGSGGFGSTGVK